MNATNNRFYRTKRRNYQRGSARYNAILTTDKVRAIRGRAGDKNAALAAEFGCSESNIEMILHRKTWKHLS